MKALPVNLIIGLVCLLLLISSAHQIWRKFTFWRWSHKLKLNRHQPLFQSLYQPVNGYLLSKQDRQQQDAPSLIYGEIEFIPFIALLSLIDVQQDSVFFDLGSGSGKAVISCAMVFQPQKAIGIEKLERLFHVSEQLRNQLHSIEAYKDCASRIQFLHQDFLNASLEEASHIFINASAFFGEMWHEIEKKLNPLPHLQWIITTTRPLKLENFECIRTTEVAMSWAVVTAYIHQRKI